jgi:acyl-CoA thioester hydrolase
MPPRAHATPLLTAAGIAWYERRMYSTMIYYQDTDAGGVVYFGNYLRFLEKSWFEYLMDIGISLPEWEKADTYVMVKTVFLDLIDKVRYGETIHVATSVKEVKNAYFILAYTISKEGRPTTKAETKMVCVDGTGKLKRMPDAFKERLIANLIA